MIQDNASACSWNPCQNPPSLCITIVSQSRIASPRAIHFEGSLFSGMATLWTKGVPSQPKHLFKGQRRKSSITVQGRFKRPVVMSHFVTGPEFTRPFVNLPAKWFVEGVLLRVSSAPAGHSIQLPFLHLDCMSYRPMDRVHQHCSRHLQLRTLSSIKET